MDIVKSSLVALSATLFCIWLLRPLALRVGLVDAPGGRKLHNAEVPLIGGVAMFFGFCFALLELKISLLPYRGLFAGSALLILMGVVDDFRELDSHLRLIGQVLASLFLIVWGDKSITNFGDLLGFGAITLGNWSIPVTVLMIMGYINSMNMIDGQDGLAGSVALSQSLCLITLSVATGRLIDTRILVLLSIVLVVFLAFNLRLPWLRREASVFMGDAGITFIAYIVAWFAIDLAHSTAGSVKPITLLWILSFPVFDLINVTIYRLRQGKSPLQAGRDHIHHVLHVKGWDAFISTLVLSILSLVMGVVGLAGYYWQVPEVWQFGGWILSFGLYLFCVRIVRRD